MLNPPNGCNKERFAILSSIIDGVIKGFLHNHDDFEGYQKNLINTSLAKRLSNQLSANDVMNRLLKVKDKTMISKLIGKLLCIIGLHEWRGETRHDKYDKKYLSPSHQKCIRKGCDKKRIVLYAIYDDNEE